MKLAYNSSYDTIEEGMSDFNIGGRRNKSMHHHIFVLRSIIQDIHKNKKACSLAEMFEAQICGHRRIITFLMYGLLLKVLLLYYAASMVHHPKFIKLSSSVMVNSWTRSLCWRFGIPVFLARYTVTGVPFYHHHCWSCCSF